MINLPRSNGIFEYVAVRLVLPATGIFRMEWQPLIEASSRLLLFINYYSIVLVGIVVNEIAKSNYLL